MIGSEIGSISKKPDLAGKRGRAFFLPMPANKSGCVPFVALVSLSK